MCNQQECLPVYAAFPCDYRVYMQISEHCGKELTEMQDRCVICSELADFKKSYAHGCLLNEPGCDIYIL